MERIREFFKKWTMRFAQWLDRISGGSITPDQITITSLILHLPIALAIVSDNLVLAGLLLIPISLLDSVDGALARVQDSESARGMLLDASTDRMKESLLFIAIAFRFALDENPYAVAISVAAITGSILVSYIKAKGETAIRGQDVSAHQINRIFQAGLMRYEIRMAVLAFGLISSWLILAVSIIAVLSWATAFYRLIMISMEVEDK